MMWMAIAAAAAYLLDPDRGEQRRKDLRKRMDRYMRAGEKARMEAGL